MTNAINIEKMTIEEKLMTMENIWKNLCKNADSLSSPDWHRDVLLEREKDERNGNNKFQNWDKAKKEIQNKTL